MGRASFLKVLRKEWHENGAGGIKGAAQVAKPVKDEEDFGRRRPSKDGRARASTIGPRRRRSRTRTTC